MNNFCKRTVTKSKYEKNDLEIRKWWTEEFKKLEKSKSLVPQERLDLLKAVLPPRFYYRLLRIWKIKGLKDAMTFEFDECQVMEKHVAIHETTENSAKKTVDSNELLNTLDYKKKVSTSVDCPFNPYLNFFKRPTDKVPIWHELTPLSRENMNLNELADDITDKVAKDFVEWLISLGGDEETTLSVESVKEMFEIGCQMTAATTLKIQLKEIPCVPEKLAESRNLPDLSKRNMLHREINRDKRAAKMQKRVIAFGKALPPECQVISPPRNISNKWLKCEKLPKKLESMATVWQGITHLRATKSFCEYIFTEKSDMKAPKYLIDSGMMNPKNIMVNESVRSGSFGDVSRYSFAFA